MSKLPTLNGNILTIHTSGLAGLVDHIRNLNLTQLSVKVLEDSVEISFPDTELVEAAIPGVLHGARVRARDKEKPDPKPPTSGPDGTPPSGGTPGSTSVWEQTYTEARAA